MVRRSNSERGFTLIELMVVVGLIGILAAVVVPGFFKESRKAKGTVEASMMFAALSTAEEQWKVDNGSYRAAAACPATPATTGQLIDACLTAGTDWTIMRINPPESTLYCSYELVTGTGTGTNNPGGFAFTSPSANWYYALATCDMDGASGNSTYFMSSMDASMQKLNEGK